MATELAEILMKNGTTGGTEIDGLLRSALWLNMEQLAYVREMGIKNHRIGDNSSKEGEVCLDMEDISRLWKSLKGIPILNNSNTSIATIGNHVKIGKIMWDLPLATYESWADMENY